MKRSSVLWTLAITSIGLFMVVLDNLVSLDCAAGNTS